MRTLGRLVAVVVTLLGSGAGADPNDFVLSRLGNPLQGDPRFDPAANGNFRVFAREMGAAITAANLMPPETLGHSAFSLSAELSVLSLDTAPAGGNGGFVMPTQDALSGALLLPSVHLRKGLPFSFELGARVGWVDKSRMFAGTAELKGALMEGFANLPDVALRVYASRLFNARDMALATGGLDLGVGKQFAIGGMVTLTPYAGWNPGFTAAQSSLVDFNPQRTPAEEEADPTRVFRESSVYSEVLFFENPHNRFYLGARFIAGVLQLGAEVSLTAFSGFDDASGRRDLPGQLAFNTTLGLDF